MIQCEIGEFRLDDGSGMLIEVNERQSWLLDKQNHFQPSRHKLYVVYHGKVTNYNKYLNCELSVIIAGVAEEDIFCVSDKEVDQGTTYTIEFPTPHVNVIQSIEVLYTEPVMQTCIGCPQRFRAYVLGTQLPIS